MKLTFKIGLTLFIMGILAFGTAFLIKLMQWASIMPCLLLGIALMFIGAVIMLSKLKEHPKFKAFMDS